MLKKLTTKKIHKIAEFYGGKCLSGMFKTYSTILQWKCGKGHIWEASTDTVLNKSWCPYCPDIIVDKNKLLEEIEKKPVKNKSVKKKSFSSLAEKFPAIANEWLQETVN